MEIVRLGLLWTHLAFGVAALALFWVPALTKKGGPRHRKAGRAYALSMAIVSATGFVLAGLFIARGRVDLGVFLTFLGLITATSLWNGWRVLRAKRSPAAYLTAGHVAVGLVNVAGGAGMIAFGIDRGMPLYYSFGPVGLLIGGLMLGLVLLPPKDPKYWMYEHFGGMIGSGIASHVAFLAFGGRQLFGWGLGGYGVVLWLAPVVAGTVAITALNFYYRRKNRQASAPTLAPAGATL